MRIAVTGASGNIGSQLLRQLHADGRVEEVVAVCRRPPTPEQAAAEPALSEGVRWVALDLAAPDAAAALAPVLVGVDAVVHLAWLIQPSHGPDVMRATNVGGSAAVFRAVVAAGTPALVYASSVGVYSPGPKDRRVPETWPTEGIPTSLYSRHKVEVERMVDGLEADHPALRVARIRPGVVVQPGAASEQARYFLGPLLPLPLLRKGLIPVVPAIPRLAVQLVHTEDVARAFAAAALADVRGAFNVADEPVLDAATIAQALDARPVPVPAALARGVVDLTWRLRLQPTDPGWVDLALQTPLMDTARARRELGWTPRHDARETLAQVLDALHRGVGGPTPVLRAITSPLGQIVGGARSLLPRAGGRI